LNDCENIRARLIEASARGMRGGVGPTNFEKILKKPSGSMNNIVIFLTREKNVI
jgi:hypothetical protein